MSAEKLRQETHCIECKSVIPRGASICSTCSSFQTPWKNQAKFIANTIGILSVTIALISYVLSVLPNVRKTIAWRDDVSVLTFIDSEATVIANTGDGELFLSHIYIKYDTDHGANTIIRLLNKPIDPGKVIVVPQESQDKDRYADYEVVSRVSNDEWNKLYNESQLVDVGGCVVLDFSSENDPLLAMYFENLGDKLSFLLAHGEIYYYSSHSGKLLNEEFPLFGILRRSSDPSCSSQ